MWGENYLTPFANILNTFAFINNLYTLYIDTINVFKNIKKIFMNSNVYQRLNNQNN